MSTLKSTAMQAKFFDLNNHPELTGHSTKEPLFNGDAYHVWVHVDQPGKKGPMHKHTADQLFYCIQGQCTFAFPNGESEILDPGMLVTIPKGQLYQLHNTGDVQMVLLGSRAESHGKERHTKNNEVIRNIEGKYVVQSTDQSAN